MIYLDHNASGPCSAEAIDAMVSAMREAPGNPGTLHAAGQTGARIIKRARRELAKHLGVKAREIVFTSGGTESNAIVVHTILTAITSPVVVASATEHPSVLVPLREAASAGRITLREIGVASDGTPKQDELEEALEDANALFMMLANNETGVMPDIRAIASTLARFPDVWWHCDTVQAVGRVPWTVIQEVTQRAQSIAISAHKFRGPRGVGLLWASGALQPLFKGGGQEGGVRGGTLNTPGIAGMAAALSSPIHAAQVGAHRDFFEARLLELFPGSIIHGQDAARLPNTTMASLRSNGEWIDGESWMLGLSERGFAVSTGSACASKSKKPSATLSAMGVEADVASASLRISCGNATPRTDYEALLEALEALKPTT